MEKRGDINPEYTPDLLKAPNSRKLRPGRPRCGARPRDATSGAVPDDGRAEIERLEKQGIAAQAAELLRRKIHRPESE